MARFQFFVLPEEFADLLSQVDERWSLVEVSETKEGTPVSDSPLCAEILTDRVFICPKSSLGSPLPETVVVLPPVVAECALLMGDIALSRKGFSKRLYSALRRAVWRLAPLGTWGTNVMRGGRAFYPDIRSSRAAAEFARNGIALRQRYVQNVEFYPEAQSDE